MKLLIILSLFMISAPLMSEDSISDKRSSNVLGTFSKGPDSYQSFVLDATLGLNSSLSLNGSFLKSDSGVATLLNEELITNEERFGADWKINKTWGTTFGIIARQEPYEINSKGGYLSINSNISHWWDGKRNTYISLKGEYLNITQKLQAQGRFVTINVNKQLEQRNAYLSLNQEIFDYLLISVAHNRYSYSEESSSLGLTTATRRITSGAGALSYGHPDTTNKLEFIFIPSEWLEVRLAASQTKILSTDSKSKTAIIGTSFFWNSFQLDAEYSKTDYGTSSGTQDSKQSYTSVGLGYNW